MLYFTFGILFIIIGVFMFIIYSTDYFDTDDFDVDSAKTNTWNICWYSYYDCWNISIN